MTEITETQLRIIVEGGAAVPVSWNIRKFNDIYHKIVKLLEKSGKEAQTENRYPLIDLYTNLYKPAGTDTMLKECGNDYKPYTAPPTDIKLKIHRAMEFPYSIADYLFNKKLDVAAQEWVFSDKHDPNEPSYQDHLRDQYHTYAIVKFYYNGFAETMYRTALPSDKIDYINEGRSKPNIESKMFLYHSSLPLLKEFFKKEFQQLTFNQYNKVMIGEVNQIWSKYFREVVVGNFNKSLYAQARSGMLGLGKKDKIDARETDPANRDRYIILRLVGEFFRTAHTKPTEWARIERSYESSEKIIKEIFDNYLTTDNRQEAVEDMLDYIYRSTESTFDETDKAALKANAEKVDNLCKDMLHSLNSGKTEIQNLLRTEFVFFYNNIMRKLHESETRGDMKDLVKNLYENEFHQSIRDSKVEELVNKAELMIRSILEPRMYRAVSLAILFIMVLKWFWFLQHAVEKSNRLTA